MARPKGSPNKVTKHGRAAIENVFERMGGPNGLYAWTQADPLNQREFYTKIWPRIIPQQIDADVRHNVSLPDFLVEFWRSRSTQSLG